MSNPPMSNPPLTRGQQFGYNGFGNFLSQTALAGGQSDSVPTPPGDPINRRDPSGLCSLATAGENGVNNNPFTGPDFSSWILTFPFSNTAPSPGDNLVQNDLNFLIGALETTSATTEAKLATGIIEAYCQDRNSPMNLVVASGSAGTLAAIWSQLPHLVIKGAVESGDYPVPMLIDEDNFSNVDAGGDGWLGDATSPEDPSVPPMFFDE